MNYATTYILANRINVTHWQFPRELVTHIVSLIWDYPLVSTRDTTTMITLNNEVYIIKFDSYGSQILRTPDRAKAAAPPGRIFAQALCCWRAYIAVATHHAGCAVYMSAISDLNTWVFVYSHPKIISLFTVLQGIAVIVQTRASSPDTQNHDGARPWYELWIGDGVVHPLNKCGIEGHDIKFAGGAGTSVAVCNGCVFEFIDEHVPGLREFPSRFTPRSVHIMNRTIVIRDIGGNYRHSVTGTIIRNILEYTEEDVFPANCLFKTAGPTGFVYATREGLYQILAPFACSVRAGIHHKVISWESLGGM